MVIYLHKCCLAPSELLLILGLTFPALPPQIPLPPTLHNRVRFPNNSIYPVRSIGIILHKLLSKPFPESPILQYCWDPHLQTSDHDQLSTPLTSSGKRYLHSILSQIRSKALWRASIYHVTSFETLCLSPDGCWLSLVFIRFGLLCFLIHRDVRASLWPSPHSTSWAICPKRLLGRAVKPSGTELPSILKTPKPFWAMPS